MQKILKKRRIESPSSILTYKQCPRKYYYQYIEKLPSGENIHTIRGNIVHTVLEKIFDIDTKNLTKENFEDIFKVHLQDLLVTHWKAKEDNFKAIGISKQEEIKFFEESMMMLFNWLHHFKERIHAHGDNFQEAFKAHTPIREQQIINNDLGVRGFIDAIETHNDEIKVMDYKTSKNFDLSEEYRLQLAIYALLYHQKHNKIPDKVGLYFLKNTAGCELSINADEELLDLAKFEIELIHMSTESDNIGDYPKHESPLCKWSSGQCAFYGICFQQKSLDDFRKEQQNL